jgi:hypothetical protein
MANDRINISREWGALLEFQLQERQATILAGLLQQPDYPPLPACPECSAAATEIADSRNLNGDVLVNIEPCGHRFRIEAS